MNNGILQVWQEKDEFRGTLVLAAIVLALGLFLTSLTVHLVIDLNESHILNSIHESIDPVLDSVVKRFDIYGYGMEEARIDILSGSGKDTTHEEFRLFGQTLDLESRFPGARGFGLVRRVRPEELEAFLQQAREEGQPDFRIRQIAPHSGELFVLQYMEPEDFQSNRVVTGLDLASETNRRRTAERAMKSGTITLTPPIQLVDKPSDSTPDAFLMLLPIYEGWKTPTTQSERIERCFGWINAPLIFADIFRDLFPESTRLSVAISDVTDANAPVRFFRNRQESGKYSHERTLEIFGRIWLIRISTTPAYIRDLHLLPVSGTALLGAVISILITLLSAIFRIQRMHHKRLIQERNKLHAIVESTLDGIIGKTMEGTVTSWNRGAELMFGYARKEAIGHPLKELIIPQRLHGEEQQLLDRIARGETIIDFETVRHRRDRSEFPVSATISPLFSTEGEIVGAFKIIRDITSQKAAESRILELNTNLENLVDQRTAQLAELNLLLSTVLAAASEFSIIASDTRGVITLFNHGAEMMLGYSAEELVGKLTPSIFHDTDEVIERGRELSQIHGERIEGFDVFIYKTRHNEIDSREWTYIRRDGVRLPVRLVVTAMRDEDDRIVGYLGIATDISEQKRAEQALTYAKEEADAANAAKSIFLANMSHEIRTPLNAVLGMLQLLAKTALDSRQYEFVSRAGVAANSLLGLINDILDYSKIESGKLELEIRPFALDPLLQKIAVVMSGNLRGKSIEFLFDFDERIPTEIVGDELRLQQVLINLLSNAIKFTEHGEVILRTRLLELTDDIARIDISVSDTGIGISRAQQKRIFEGFTQAEASITRRYGGTGLGLVISRRLIELMGGQLRLDSEPGRGSSFAFTLELPVPETSDRVPVRFANPVKILVVDDNAAARRITGQALARLGAEVCSAASGPEALHLLRQEDDDARPFQCVLMDWRMQDPDGIAVARTIRACPSLSHMPRIILITAASHEEVPVLGADSPFDALMNKPVTQRQFVQTITGVLAGTRSQGKRRKRTQETAEHLKGLHILLVEDNPFNQMVAREFLSGEGAEVTVAADGQEGLDALCQEKAEFDLVLMDMQMPRMDGLTATRIIRQNPAFDSLPILAMTANVSQKDHDACLQAGMNDHIGKPLDFDEVLATLARFTDVPEGSGQSAGTSGDTPDGLVEVLARFGGNRRLYRKVLEQFLPSFRQQTASLAQAVDERQWETALATLHTMKGISGTAGLARLYDFLVRKEAALKQSGPEEFPALLEGVAGQIGEMASSEHAELEQMIGPDPDGKAASPDSGMALHRLLDEIDENLASGNMRALELAETLPGTPGAPPNALIEEFMTYVYNLEFAKARQSLEKFRTPS